MNLHQAGQWVIPIVLVIVGIIAGMYLSGMFPASPAHNPDTGMAAGSHSFNTTSVAAYCIIMEYNATQAADANLISLTDKDFCDFPEFTKWMNGSTGSSSWYNGARSAGDFIDCQGRFHAFLNLSCRNLSPEEMHIHLKEIPRSFCT